MSPGPTMERVYLELKARLRSDEFPPGSRLGPAELAKLLEASPTPVRDALYRLSGERIVESWHLEGFRQPLLNEGDLQDLYGWSGTLIGLALKGRADVAPPGTLFELPRSADYPRGIESLFRMIASGTAGREIRHAIVNIVERTHVFRSVEARIDVGAIDALEAMEQDFRFGRWTALRSKITSFHRNRVAQAGRVISELRQREEPLR